MKVSDLIALALHNAGVKTVFGVSGGASLHLIKSIIDQGDLNFVSLHHEQNAGMAADGVSRSTKYLGCAIGTSGPGATNFTTAIAGSFFDSIPVVFIVGQVSTNRQRGNLSVRQIGFQETPFLDMIKPVVKSTLRITKENFKNVYLEVSDLINLAKSGRPGPVVIEVPDDLQREKVELVSNVIFNENSNALGSMSTELPNQFSISDESINTLREMVMLSKRPVLILGNGVNIAGSRNAFQEFAQELGWPILLTWGAKDLIPSDFLHNLGTFGTHGNRIANLVVQNADLLISFGTRLDTKSTGSPISSFSPLAKKVMIDIDPSEISKFKEWGARIDLGFSIDLRSADVRLLIESIKQSQNDTVDWIERIEVTKKIVSTFEVDSTGKSVFPSVLLRELSDLAPSDATIFVDTGCTVAWTMKFWQTKNKHRIFHDFNNTAMGWALPAAIGFSHSTNTNLSIILVGDGSFMMSMQDLSALTRASIPPKLIVLNNNGYSMIKQTQEQWFDAQYFASSGTGDFDFPDYEKLAHAFKFEYLRIENNEEIKKTLTRLFDTTKPILCEVIIDSNERVQPQVKFGNTIEHMDPELPEGKVEQISNYLQSGIIQ
jgi:acetolactate synthase-1/2/3 large subunit